MVKPILKNTGHGLLCPDPKTELIVDDQNYYNKKELTAEYQVI